MSSVTNESDLISFDVRNTIRIRIDFLKKELKKIDAKIRSKESVMAEKDAKVRAVDLKMNQLYGGLLLSAFAEPSALPGSHEEMEPLLDLRRTFASAAEDERLRLHALYNDAEGYARELDVLYAKIRPKKKKRVIIDEEEEENENEAPDTVEWHE